jgi:uncharacterized membrane protein
VRRGKIAFTKEVSRMIEMTKVPEQRCSSGVEQRVAVLLCYLLGWVGGLIFFIIEKENKFVRFCAMQSIILSAAGVSVFVTFQIFGGILGLIAGPVGTVFFVMNLLVSLAMIGLVVLLSVQGWKGVKVVLPYVSRFAEQWSKTAEA